MRRYRQVWCPPSQSGIEDGGKDGSGGRRDARAEGGRVKSHGHRSDRRG